LAKESLLSTRGRRDNSLLPAEKARFMIGLYNSATLWVGIASKLADGYVGKSGTHARKVNQQALYKPRNRRALILPLVVGMVIVAVQAKTLHYSPKTAQARYFSASVKIANLAPQDRQLQPVAVLVSLPTLHRTEAWTATHSEPSPKTIHLPLEGLQSRSPPSTVL
jgi:hypothetical protein